MEKLFFTFLFTAMCTSIVAGSTHDDDSNYYCMQCCATVHPQDECREFCHCG